MSSETPKKSVGKIEVETLDADDAHSCVTITFKLPNSLYREVRLNHPSGCTIEVFEDGSADVRYKHPIQMRD